jgi:UDP-N-acetylglucosamine 2-epimerase (non-hydrolysing)
MIKTPKLIMVAGARPNFMKIAPIMRIVQRRYAGKFQVVLVHTGQHYDYEMSQAFFDDLELRQADYYLGVGSSSHAVQTAQIMIAFEEVCLKERPQIVVVVGDVNSTVACALVAKKLGIRLAHVEAGLRSYDLTMPEEINRMVTDLLADFLFVSERSGIINLKKEGRSESAIHFVGNVMIDNLYFQLSRLAKTENQAVKPAAPYAVLTLHRPSNVDAEEKLREIMGALAIIAGELTIHFPAHPRTRQHLEAIGLLGKMKNIHLLSPLPYQAFLRLWKEAALILTDSGGLQEETTALGIPCITLRENTERPITVEEGTNILAGTSGSGILAAYESYKTTGGKKGRIPELWDGRAAERIVAVLAEHGRVS